MKFLYVKNLTTNNPVLDKIHDCTVTGKGGINESRVFAKNLLDFQIFTIIFPPSVPPVEKLQTL